MLIPALAAALAATACQSAPEEEVVEARADYDASLNGYVIREVPLMDDLTTGAMPTEDETVAGEEIAADAEDDAAAESFGIEAEDLAPVPARRDAVLDILLKSDTYDQLPGLTLDISMADPAGAEKAHWRVWVETSDLVKGGQKQVTHTLEDVPYEEGDGFHVEIRQDVPPGERGEYREFSAAGQG